MYSLTFSLCFILMVLSFLMELSNNLSVLNLLTKAWLRNCQVNLSGTSISKNQSSAVPARANGNILTKSLGAPSLYSQHAKEYLAKNLVGSSLPLKIGNSLLPILVLAWTLGSRLSTHSSWSSTTSSLSTIWAVLGLGSDKGLCSFVELSPQVN